MDEVSLSGCLCLIKGQKTIFVDKRLNTEARVKQLALCLGGQNLEQYYMLPALRHYLEGLTGPLRQIGQFYDGDGWLTKET